MIRSRSDGELRRAQPTRRSCRHHVLALVMTVFWVAAGTVSAGTSECKLIKITQWPVRMEHNVLTVDGAINGHKVRILIDTGAAMSAIPRSAAARLALPGVDTDLSGVAVGGLARLGVAHIDTLTIGEATRRNWQVWVIGEHDLGKNLGFILGYDFLRNVDIEFDLAAGVIRLFQAKDCKGVSLAYWAPGGASEAFIELEAINRSILLPVHLNGKSIQAMLDSGATGSVVSIRQAARLGITPQSPGVVAGRRITGFGERQVDVWIGLFQSFAIGGEIIWNPKIEFAELPHMYWQTSNGLMPTTIDVWDMVLGVDFLRTHRVFVAHSQRKVYFTYIGGQVFMPDTIQPADQSSPTGSEAGQPQPTEQAR